MWKLLSCTSILNELLQPLQQEKQPARVRPTQSYSDWSSSGLERITLGQRGSEGAHTDMSNGKQLLGSSAKNTHTCV